MPSLPLFEDKITYGKINDRNIYLEINEFERKCSELNVEANDRLLESYEKFDLLYPAYRIIRPKEYLQKIFEQNHGPDRHKLVIEIPDEYASLYKFEHQELNGWHFPSYPAFEKALTEGHPLDQAFKQGESFIQVPSKGVSV